MSGNVGRSDPESAALREKADLDKVLEDHIDLPSEEELDLSFLALEEDDEEVSDG